MPALAGFFMQGRKMHLRLDQLPIDEDLVQRLREKGGL